MGDYCTIEDVWEQIKIDSGEMTDDNVEKRITQAEHWVNGIQKTTYSAPVDELIKYATACYAASLIFDYLFTESEPNFNNMASSLRKRAREYLDSYTTTTQDPESGMEKVNSDFFDVDTG